MVLLFDVLEFIVEPDNGDGFIKGIIKDIGNQKIPLAYHPVKLFRQDLNRFVRTVITDENGEYVMKNITRDGVYFIVSHYKNESKNAEIADNIRPERDSRYDHIIG